MKLAKLNKPATAMLTKSDQQDVGHDLPLHPRQQPSEHVFGGDGLESGKSQMLRADLHPVLNISCTKAPV
jgi:hypothetical protein